MSKGTIVHAALEHRLKAASWEGVASVIGEYDLDSAAITPEQVLSIAVANEELMPRTPVPERHVEAAFTLSKKRTGAAYNILGVIDWIEATDNRISDHKTLSNDNYKLTLTELKLHPQAVIYAQAGRLLYGMQEPLTFRHIYYPTSSRARADTSEVIYTNASLDDLFGRLVDYSHVIAQTAQAEQPQDAKPNFSACGDYGGCPFAGLCKVVGDEPHLNDKLLDLKGDIKMKNKKSLAERIKEAKAAKQQNASPESKKEALPINPPESKTPVKKTKAQTPKDKPKAKKKTEKPAEQEDINANWAAHASDHGLNPQANPLQTVTMGQAIEGSEKKFNPIHRILLINCVPRTMEVQYFDKWIQAYVDEVLQKHHAAHYMLPPLDYGKGKAEIALAVKTDISKGTKPPTVMCVDRKHPLADTIIAEIVGTYDEVIERI